MMRYKSSIQLEIIPRTTTKELNDIRDCCLNITLIKKLADIGRQHFIISDKSDTTLYCICMAIGTIIKEYDWGTKYIQQGGMLDMATMIAG